MAAEASSSLSPLFSIEVTLVDGHLSRSDFFEIDNDMTMEDLANSVKDVFNLPFNSRLVFRNKQSNSVIRSNRGLVPNINMSVSVSANPAVSAVTTELNARLDEMSAAISSIPLISKLLDERLPLLSEQISLTSQAISQMVPIMIGLMDTHNFYTPSKLTRDRDDAFRQDVINFYYKDSEFVEFKNLDGSVLQKLVYPLPRNAGRRSRIACMLTGLLGNNDSVIAAHIVPHCVPAHFAVQIGLTVQEIDSPNNALLLAEYVEQAFDRLDISFVPVTSPADLAPNMYKLKFWTPLNLRPGEAGKNHPGDARRIPICRFGFDFPQSKIGDYADAILCLGHAVPLKRALSYQCAVAFVRAISNGWATKSDLPVDFGTPRDSAFQNSRLLLVKASQLSQLAGNLRGGSVDIESLLGDDQGNDEPEDFAHSEENDYCNITTTDFS